MLLQPHVLCTSRPYPEGRQRGLTGSTLPFPKRLVCRIVIPETARGINRPTLRTRTTKGELIHAGSLDPH
ncbi:hypothetical protein BHE74_00026996 [Ensete ventricosum]|nr:hypothetical protein BHE74_00026996 [Ensete ventricosum]